MKKSLLVTVIAAAAAVAYKRTTQPKPVAGVWNNPTLSAN